MVKVKLGGIMQSDGRSLVRIMSVADSMDAAGRILGSLGEDGINIELLVETFDMDDRGNFSMVIARKDLDHALGLLDDLKNTVKARGITHVPDVAVISVFGPHLREKPRVPGLMFSALAGSGVTPLAIATSISSVSCAVPGPDLDQAVEGLLEVFEAPFQVRKRPKDY